MKKWLFMSLALYVCQCANNIAGTGTETSTKQAKVIGTIVDEQGNAAANTHVMLIPVSYNPVADRDVPDSLTDTTNSQGGYEVERLDPGTYNVQARHLDTDSRLVRTGVVLDSADTMEIPVDTLRIPGTAVLDLPTALEADTVVVFVFGTTIRKSLDSSSMAQGYALLDSLPAGKLPPVYYTTQFSPVLPRKLHDTLTVSAGDTISTKTGKAYHLSPNGSDSHDGITAPWKTLRYGLGQLGAGDSLLMDEGTYPIQDSAVKLVASGMPGAPIVVQAATMDSADPRVVWDITAGAGVSNSTSPIGYWIFNGIHFQHSVWSSISLGTSDSTRVTNQSIRHCRFSYSGGGIQLNYSENVVIESCSFYRIQSPEENRDRNAINLTYKGESVTIRNCTFEDVSSSGVDIGDRQGDFQNVLVENCRFWINRKADGTLVDDSLQQQWGNTGRHGIRVANIVANGAVTIRGCTVEGYRPVLVGQNATSGGGDGIIAFMNSNNVRIEQCLVRNCTYGIFISGNDATGRVVENCIVTACYRNGLMIKGTNISVVHNTVHGCSIAMELDRSPTLTVRNNLFWRCGHRGSYHGSADVDYNAWIEMQGMQPDNLKGANDVIGMEAGMDSVTFAIQAGSVLIDKGDPGAGVQQDFFGNSRDSVPDIGASELATATKIRTGPQRRSLWTLE